MDIKADATRGYHTALDAANQEPTGSLQRRRYMSQAMVYKRLRQICAQWTGEQRLEAYLKAKLMSMSTRESNAIYKAILELGYRL